jgi:hypothetical protein
MTNQGQPKREDLAGVRDVALANGWTYRRAYDSVLRGLFGQPIQRDGRLFVPRAVVNAGKAAE